MVSNMHSCHSTETMPWLVIFTDQSTSQLSPCALLKSSCSQWTLRHEKAVDVATMSISQSVRRSDPQSILLRGQKREVFALSATYPLIEVLLKKNRSIWHPLLEKNRPKAKAKDTVSSFPKTGKQHLTLWPATHLPRSNHRLLWAAIMHTPHSPGSCRMMPLALVERTSRELATVEVAGSYLLWVPRAPCLAWREDARERRWDSSHEERCTPPWDRLLVFRFGASFGPGGGLAWRCWQWRGVVHWVTRRCGSRSQPNPHRLRRSARVVRSEAGGVLRGKALQRAELAERQSCDSEGVRVSTHTELGKPSCNGGERAACYTRYRWGRQLICHPDLAESYAWLRCPATLLQGREPP